MFEKGENQKKKIDFLIRMQNTWTEWYRMPSPYKVVASNNTRRIGAVRAKAACRRRRPSADWNRTSILLNICIFFFASKIEEVDFFHVFYFWFILSQKYWRKFWMNFTLKLEQK